MSTEQICAFWNIKKDKCKLGKKCEFNGPAACFKERKPKDATDFEFWLMNRIEKEYRPQVRSVLQNVLREYRKAK